MLSVPPPTRVAIGTVEIAGKRYEVFASVEWARYFQQLNAQTIANSASVVATQPHTTLLNDATEEPDVFPGPPGPAGAQGDPGLALFLVQDSPEALDVLPGPPGPAGSQGDPGLALFLLQDSFDDQAIPSRPSADLSSPPPIGNGAPASGSFTTLTASGGFGCNGKSAQSSVTVNAASTDLASVIALCNQLRAALIANGIAA